MIRFRASSAWCTGIHARGDLTHAGGEVAARSWPSCSDEAQLQHLRAGFDKLDDTAAHRIVAADAIAVHAERRHARVGPLAPVVGARHAGGHLAGMAELQRLASAAAGRKRERVTGPVDAHAALVLLERMRPAAVEAHGVAML